MDEKKEIPDVTPDAADTPQEERKAPPETGETDGAAIPAEDAEAPEPEEAEEEAAEETGEGAPRTRREKHAAAAELKKLRAENASLTQKLKEAAAQADEQKDKYLRTLAEYDNFRKRTARERDGIYADAAADCVKDLLPLIDNLERASQYTESDKVAEGVKMILGSVPAILEKLRIEPFGAPGDVFNPALHNAVMHVDDEEHGEGEILEVFQRGYRHGDRIIRYAMVKVAN